MSERKKPYVCYACKDGNHMLCASDLDKKHVCQCDKTWHVEIDGDTVTRFKGAVRQVTKRAVQS